MRARRPRLSAVRGRHCVNDVRFVDHITGEELSQNKLLQRIHEGVYSPYHVRHLPLARETLGGR